MATEYDIWGDLVEIDHAFEFGYRCREANWHWCEANQRFMDIFPEAERTSFAAGFCHIDFA